VDFSQNEEQKQLRDLVKQFCKREVDPKRLGEIEEKISQARTVEEMRTVYPYDLLEKAHAVGLRQLQVPVRYGGTAPETDRHQTMTMISEEAAYWGGLSFMMVPLGAFTSTANPYITEEQKEWIFSKFLSNPRFMVAQTVSEPAGATDIHLPFDEGGKSILQVTAYKYGDEWVINGDKMYGSGVGLADYIMVAARTDKEAPVSQAMTYFWVPSDAPGVTITPNRGLGGNCQSHYDNVRVPESHIIGQVNKGFANVKSFFEDHGCNAAAQAAGMRRIYEEMREYAKQRVVGGKPLIKHSSIAAKLGEVAISLEALRNFGYRVAWELDQQEKSPDRGQREINLFWAQAGGAFGKQIAWRLCEIASDVYGGLSGSLDFHLEGFMRNTFMTRAAGLTVNVELIQTCWEYDDRYRAA
jgi:alkylation response protein AidB-like acyl-CoA dehydrogenase